MELQYEQDLFIDESALDVECLNQPLLMRRYTKELSIAEKEVARLKEQIDVEQAKLDRDIRNDPKKYNLGDFKITEAVVEGVIKTDKRMQEFRSQLIDALYEVNMLKGAVDSVRQRKDMLQELVKLHGQNYFAGPSVPRDLTHEVKQKIVKEQSNTTIKIRTKRTT